MSHVKCSFQFLTPIIAALKVLLVATEVALPTLRTMMVAEVAVTSVAVTSRCDSLVTLLHVPGTTMGVPEKPE